MGMKWKWTSSLDPGMGYLETDSRRRQAIHDQKAANDRDSLQRWKDAHPIDPNTGEWGGGSVPDQAGLEWQDKHNQAIWRLKQKMALDAVHYAQGAQGLLTSFRAGGGAALQSNIYGQVANMQMQRADMLQPLDLLSAYRENAIKRGKNAGRTESTVGAVLQGVGAVASLIPGVGTAVGLGLMAAGGAVGGIGARKSMEANMQAQQLGSTGLGGGGGMQVSQPQSQSGGGWAEAATAIGKGMQAYNQAKQPTPTTADPRGGLPKDFIGPPPAPQAQGGGSAMQSTLGQESVGGPNTSAGGGKPQAGGGQQAIAAPAIVGVDGRFDPTAYAQYAAATSPVPEYTQVALSEHLVQTLESDPSWALFSSKVDQELFARMTA